MEGGLRVNGEFHKKSYQEKPLISVITITLNTAHTLDTAIQSVLNQTYDNIEYIIIDGGSTDDTLKIIRKYEARIDYWVSEPDRGIYDAMNKGIVLATGELIGMLNAGDYYEKKGLAAAMAAYSKNKVPGIYFGHTYLI
ncbi:MAG TPA: glycosyltransferase, partial [Nitrospiraceae bacterium]|nr:glycosyltransferase [Nitrospiraceae bacterium]